MSDIDELRRILARIDGRGYKAYKDLAGSYRMEGFRLTIDHVQGDPFAAPSRLRVTLPFPTTGLSDTAASTPTRRITTGDWLLRRAAVACQRVRSRRGSGKSGLLAVDEPGQEVLERSAVRLDDDRVELRLVAGLPAAGRRVLGDEAEELLCEDLAGMVDEALVVDPGDLPGLEQHLAAVEDQRALRAALPAEGLVAFVGDGAHLPRVSGVSDAPLGPEQAVTWEAPESLAVTLETPHRGPVRGLGIPRGVTLVVGGGYHGKSTLLSALSRGVYDHVPGDGRELVVTDPTAVKIRAEDGRRVEAVDISPFISGLPTGDDTTAFRTENASGSTSQAASIIEALELRVGALLIDEDTSATNFMIRDRRMQMLVAKRSEPITPFVDLVRPLYEDLGVSTVLVMGGSGDYLDVADTVIQMDAFRPIDVTDDAARVARELPTGRIPEAGEGLAAPSERVPDPASIDPRRGKRNRIRGQGTDGLTFGREEVDLRAVEQIVSDSQTRAIGHLLRRLAERHLDGDRGLAEALEAALGEVDDDSLDVLSPFSTPVGDLARPRLQDVGAALNRLRSVRIR